MIEKHDSRRLTVEEHEELESWYQHKAQQEAAWNLDETDTESGLEARMLDKVTAQIRPSERRPGKMLWRWCAAAAVLLLAVSTAYYFWPANQVDERVVYRNQKSTENRFIQLPDSTKVLLKPDGQLIVDFSDKLRSVELQGEAFFDVAHLPDMPFEVRTGKFHTKVLGTQFLVKATKASELTVSVKQGEVAVFRQDENQELGLLRAKQGLYATENLSDKTLTIETRKLDLQTVDSDLRWIDNDLKFNGISLGDLLERLSSRYQATIRITDPELKASRIHGAFDGTESLESVLRTLSTLTGTQLSKQEDTFIMQ